jgi:Na+/H+-translocating membrane pyrophosphatase
LRAGGFSALIVVGMTVMGVAVLFASFYVYLSVDSLGAMKMTELPLLLVGYGFGASFVALFAQLGGGIYTKAADVGADLVGKVERGIPEDDPRNPAVIADLVSLQFRVRLVNRFSALLSLFAICYSHFVLFFPH